MFFIIGFLESLHADERMELFEKMASEESIEKIKSIVVDVLNSSTKEVHREFLLDSFKEELHKVKHEL